MDIGGEKGDAESAAGENSASSKGFRGIEDVENDDGKRSKNSGDCECERENDSGASCEAPLGRSGCARSAWKNDSGASCGTPSVGRLLAVQRMTVDRFEGEAHEIAVCELDDGTFADVPVADLPEGAREGTVLKRAEGGMWVIDADEETARRARIQRKMDALFV